MSETVHSMAPHHIPGFLPGPDGSDWLFSFTLAFLLLLVLLIGVAYFTLHALPEKMAHRANSAQMQLIGILSILALFTHNNLFWVMALLLAAIKLPDLATPLESIAQSFRRMNQEPDPDLEEEETAPAEAEAEDAVIVEEVIVEKIIVKAQGETKDA